MKAKETKSAGGVVLNSNGEVLVVSQRGTSWSLPKGHIDEGEDSLSTAKREVFEESGIKELKYIKEFKPYKRFKISQQGGDDFSEEKTIVMFLFSTEEQKLNPVDAHNPEARWVSKEKVAGLLTHPKDKEFFISILNEI